MRPADRAHCADPFPNLDRRPPENYPSLNVKDGRIFYPLFWERPIMPQWKRSTIPFLICFAWLGALPAGALAKQCVYNAGGYALRVDWFAPQDLGLVAIEGHHHRMYCPNASGNSWCNDINSKRKNQTIKQLSVANGKIVLPTANAEGPSRSAEPDVNKFILKASGEAPVQTDIFPIGQGRCIGRPGGPYTAVISAQGRAGAVESLKIFLSALYIAALSAADEKICHGTGCGIDYSAQWESINGELEHILPRVGDVFYIGISPTDKWLGVKGTVYNPSTYFGDPIDTKEAKRTGCHLWTDDFDAWCRKEFANDWGMKSRSGYGCPAGQGKADCAAGFAGGDKIAKGVKLTGCHLWTDNFDWWCKKEFGSAYSLDTKQGNYGKGGYGCFTGQGKGICTR